MNIRAQVFGNNLPIIGFEMWYVFDFSCKTVIIIVVSGLKLYALTVVAARVKLKSVSNPFAQRSHHVLVLAN